MLRIILSVIDILICIALSVCVLLQEGKNSGLGSLSGSSEIFAYNGTTKEGVLGRATIILSVLFFVCSILISMHPFA